MEPKTGASGDWSGVPGWTGSEIGLEAPVPNWAEREPGVEVTQVPGVAQGTQPERDPPSSTFSRDAVFPASFFSFLIFIYLAVPGLDYGT